MGDKPTYGVLEARVEALEKELAKHKKLATSLRESENKFYSLVETTSDWLWEVDLNGKYTYASPKVKDILGYEADEIVGFNFLDFLSNEEVAPNQEFFKNMRRHPIPFSSRRVTQIRKDGRPVIIDVNGAPVFDKEGKLAGFCGCDKDITRKVRSEETLKESEERYRNLFENTQAGVFRASLDGSEIFDVNNKFSEIFGYPIKDILQKASPFSLMQWKDMKKLFQRLAESGNVEDYEVQAITKNGNKITCLASAKLFSKQEYVEGTIVDITKRKKTEMALRERETELDIKNESLEEMNAALRVLLNKREEDKKELEEKVLLNVQRLLIPFLDKLKISRLDEKQKSYVDILESNLADIITPFSSRLSSNLLKLTPAEIQISNLVKQGKESKEIAALLNLSITTIETHRRNIRKKIGLNDRKQNLRTYLLDLHDE